jgi:hypothetical protein
MFLLVGHDQTLSMTLKISAYAAINVIENATTNDRGGFKNYSTGIHGLFSGWVLLSRMARYVFGVAFSWFIAYAWYS